MLKKVHRVPVGLFPRQPSHTRKGRFLTVKIAPNGVGFRRYGVVVPKAAAGRAVERNRLKRFIYRSLVPVARESAEDVIVIVKQVPASGLAALEAEIRELTKV